MLLWLRHMLQVLIGRIAVWYPEAASSASPVNKRRLQRNQTNSLHPSRIGVTFKFNELVTEMAEITPLQQWRCMKLKSLSGCCRLDLMTPDRNLNQMRQKPDVATHAHHHLENQPPMKFDLESLPLSFTHRTQRRYETYQTFQQASRSRYHDEDLLHQLPDEIHLLAVWPLCGLQNNQPEKIHEDFTRTSHESQAGAIKQRNDFSAFKNYLQIPFVGLNVP